MEYSDIITGIVTFVVGMVALIVYWMQKRSEKEAAATILVMDIRHTEQVISAVLERNAFDNAMGRPVGFNNWEKYKHYFAKDLSSDEFSAFNRFFFACGEIAGARDDMRRIFMSGLEAKGAAIQALLCDLDSTSPDYQKKRVEIINTSGNELYVFDPQEPKDRIVRSIQVMGRLTQNSGFVKLKKVARMKS
ncbi:hypothetical protein [Pseudomonas sp. BNK-30]|uniref:hypothetical protein n=1 Tax=Pseudomonas sp. BNK-30 TaxID=3376165 RepID=UPI0039BFAAF3